MVRKLSRWRSRSLSELRCASASVSWRNTLVTSRELATHISEIETRIEGDVTLMTPGAVGRRGSITMPEEGLR